MTTHHNSKQPNYAIHDDMYVQAKNAGWAGWGGNERLTNSEQVTRFFAIDAPMPKGKLLELGCGEGHLCRAFAQHGYDVTGVDIFPTAIEWAKEKALSSGIKGRFFVADLTDESVHLPERYQVIIDGNCLHCIIGDDRRTFLKKVHGYLADPREGSLADPHEGALQEASVFFVSSLCSKGDSYQLFKDGIVYRHISSAEDLVAELEQSGFSILDIQRSERETNDHITIHAVKSD
ncbi:Ubiquinone biosynthesis O-methyltransferase [Marinomonas spartinae]|uniref:Ubiquinone biosynthesis O-methyltransferase n=1 Tax=Marinomonas spartinae TaxID=1792290 RepID=A0A1A8TJI3_9GAMM|nr:class I SAM-dependent methyltransferase [Marinomonas spartinae]SBS33611.1 Ubiquinone biosynthesis O-methyltransferase [Marinomonas spartinae]